MSILALLVAAVLGFALVSAQTSGFHSINKPSQSDKVQAGSTFNIKWTVASQYASGTCVIKLIAGMDQNALEAAGAVGKSS